MQGGPGGQAQAQEDKQRQVEDMKNSILNQVLTQEARARCKYHSHNLIYYTGTNEWYCRNFHDFIYPFFTFSEYATCCKTRKRSKD